MTSPSERDEYLQACVEDVLTLSKGPRESLLGICAQKARGHGDDARLADLVLRYPDRTEYWAMTICPCHGVHDGGWRLDLVVGVN